MQSKTLVVVPGGKVWASRQQADTLEALTLTRKGGFARVYGYKPASNYEVPPVQDIVMVTSPDSSMDLHPALRVLPTDSTVTVPRVSSLVNVTAGASGLPQGFALLDCLEGWLQFTLLCDCTVAL